jgi:hypothetical protein
MRQENRIDIPGRQPKLGKSLGGSSPDVKLETEIAAVIRDAAVSNQRTRSCKAIDYGRPTLCACKGYLEAGVVGCEVLCGASCASRK